MELIDEVILVAAMLAVVGFTFALMSGVATPRIDDRDMLYSTVIKIHLAIEYLYNNNDTVKVVPLSIPMDHRIIIRSMLIEDTNYTAITILGEHVDELLEHDIEKALDESDIAGIVNSTTYTPGNITITYRDTALIDKELVLRHSATALKLHAYVDNNVTFLEAYPEYIWAK